MDTGISNENLSDFNWKNKLEDVSGLPGEILTDKNASWEKLNSRLRQKQRRFKAIWYWVAAACFLLAIIIPRLADRGKQDGLVKNYPAPIQPKKIAVPEILPSKENIVANVPISLTEIKKIVKPPVQTNVKKFRSNHPPQKEEIILNDFNVQNDMRQQLPIPASLIDSSIEIKLALAPVKKKLKVVHINELGDPNDENSTIARYYEPRSFKLKLINQGAYTSPSPSSNYTGFTFFKTKIPPSN